MQQPGSWKQLAIFTTHLFTLCRPSWLLHVDNTIKIIIHAHVCTGTISYRHKCYFKPTWHILSTLFDRSLLVALGFSELYLFFIDKVYSTSAERVVLQSLLNKYVYCQCSTEHKQMTIPLKIKVNIANYIYKRCILTTHLWS